MSNTNNVFTVEDLLRIKEYARISALMPTYLEDVIHCLGYDNSSSQPLSPESFLELFQSINNNGRDWISNVEPRFEERLNAMVEFYNSYSGNLRNALDSINEMINSGEIGDMQPIRNAISNAWSELLYQEAKNYNTCEHLKFFTDTLVSANNDLQSKIDLGNQITNVDIKKFLFDLSDEFQLITSFSLDAEASAQSLWTQWTTLSEELETAKNAAQDVSQQSDVVDLYVALSDIMDGLEDAHAQTQYMLECFQNADNRYNNDYPGGVAPLGSYMTKSSDITVVLKAECQKADGSWQHSQIDMSNINPQLDEFYNNNGQLTLGSDPSSAKYLSGYCYYPAGTYRETCRNIQVILTAQCTTDSGSSQPSTFSLTDEFIIKLKNNNGVLTKET
ncbi:hypothetical protein PCC7424_3042 [Gloeothece citriformis PCC 7424]|uniref:Cyanovirin-N domain-containing protein n=1 Tax=Gloeothece citriformis (strain PCC 7424) TaxID=65393 RepID=B7KB88_GLOC7|nr:CVNH domain-containing protein [Gloeothece citriformis]ACK71444.1 hypothetical protein PCC7424_3042 [Gloeothece citriformis PCC 7424]